MVAVLLGLWVLWLKLLLKVDVKLLDFFLSSLFKEVSHHGYVYQPKWTLVAQCEKLGQCNTVKWNGILINHCVVEFYVYIEADEYHIWMLTLEAITITRSIFNLQTLLRLALKIILGQALHRAIWDNFQLQILKI